MAGSQREQLAATFDQAAELYDRARPGYPAALIEVLTSLAAIGAGSRVLELGCGTGQLTVPLAQRGCAVTALDRGPKMRRSSWAATTCSSADPEGEPGALAAGCVPPRPARG
jgi:ubiquinone/menaquinone biosynthesis C-methylase UbiE